MNNVFLDYATVSFNDDLDPAALRRAIPRLELRPHTAQADVATAITGAEIVLVNKLRLSRESIERTPTLKLIALAATPPSLAADLVAGGVLLPGGGALLGDLDLALREQTGLSISIADQSLNCVALGTGKALEYEKQLRHVIDYDS